MQNSPARNASQSVAGGKIKMQKYNLKLKILESFYFTFCIVILIFTFYIFNLKKIYAQGVSLAINPPLLEVMIKPGKTITQVYKLTNYGDPTIVTSKIYPFEPKDDQGHLRILNTGNDTSGSPLSWFSFLNANLSLGEPFFLGSNETQEAVLKITVPKDAAEGDYYYSLLFTSESPPKGEKSQSRATATIGSNLLLTISNSGNTNIKGEIQEFSAPRLIDSFDSLPVRLVLRNTGNAFFKPQGKITLSGLLLRASFQILPQNILTNSTRLLTATPSGEISQNVSKPITLAIPGFFLGLYQLSTTIDIVEGRLTLHRSISVFGFPFKISFILIFGIIICYVIIRLRKKKR